MTTPLINLLSQRPQASGINITSFSYRHSFDQISPNISVEHKFSTPNTLNNIGDVGTDFNFSFYGTNVDSYLVSKEVVLSGGGKGEYAVNANFLGAVTKNTLRTPKKPWKFMTMTAGEIEIFLKYTGTPGLYGTAREYLEFIPFIKKGDSFYNFGWKAKEIARQLCSVMGLNLITNIPDYYIKEISVEGTFFNTVLEILGRYSPKYFVENGNLYVISYGGTNSTISTGYMILKDAGRITYNETYIDTPNAVKVYGGDGEFILENYVGKKSSTTSLVKYAEYLSFAEDFFQDEPELVFYSYGEPYTFNEVSNDIGVLSPENFPDLDELATLTKRFKSSDDLRTENKANFVTEVTQYHHRTVFDEPGEIFYKSTKTILDRVDQIGQVWGEPIVVAQTFEYSFFGRTVDYRVETPILTSYTTSELANMDGVLNEPFQFNTVDYLTEKFNPTRVLLECALLPNKISNDLKASTVKKLMPKSLTYEYRIHARKTDDTYIEGDIIMECSLTYEVCVMSSDGMRKRLKENLSQADFRGTDIILPFVWNFYNPSNARISDLTISQCLTEKMAVRYYRHGEKIHRKVTTTSYLDDTTGRIETRTTDETINGEMPNERLMPRKLPMQFTIEKTTTSLNYWDTPIYELRDPNIVNFTDLKRIARHLDKTVVRPNYTVSFTLDFPMFVDIGSKIVFLDDRIRNPNGTIQELPPRTKCVISNVGISTTAENATATTDISVDVYY